MRLMSAAAPSVRDTSTKTIPAKSGGKPSVVTTVRPR
jgi:hypothetical protein